LTAVFEELLGCVKARYGPQLVLAHGSVVQNMQLGVIRGEAALVKAG
jgi:hypothetical protein